MASSYSALRTDQDKRLSKHDPHLSRSGREYRCVHISKFNGVCSPPHMRVFLGRQVDGASRRYVKKETRSLSPAELRRLTAAQQHRDTDAPAGSRSKNPYKTNGILVLLDRELARDRTTL